MHKQVYVTFRGFDAPRKELLEESQHLPSDGSQLLYVIADLNNQTWRVVRVHRSNRKAYLAAWREGNLEPNYITSLPVRDYEELDLILDCHYQINSV